MDGVFQWTATEDHTPFFPVEKVVSPHALNMGDWILFRLAKPEP